MLSAGWTSRSSAQFEAQRSARGATVLTYFDFVYASQNARLQYPFISLALVPEFGTSFSLPDQVGYLRAAEIVLLGRPLDASRALSMGLVTEVLPGAEVLATTERIAQELAQKPLAALKLLNNFCAVKADPRLHGLPRTKWWSLAKECARQTLVRRLLPSSRNGLHTSTPAKLHSQGSLSLK
jgi:enoyl-CoA hydratase/carnithine racemase